MRKFLLTSILTAIALTGSAIASYGEEINPVSVTDSGCKGSDYAPSVPAREYGEELSSWTVSYNEGKLIVTWHDLLVNCSVYGFDSKIIREGNKLIFSIDCLFDPIPMDCECLYDITATYEGIEPGHYTIVFAYSWGEEIGSGEIDLEEGYSHYFDYKTAGIEDISASGRKLRVEEGVAKVNCKGKFRLEIFSANGVKEYTLENEDDAEVNLDRFGKGIHYLRLTPAEGRVITLPIIR